MPCTTVHASRPAPPARQANGRLEMTLARFKLSATFGLLCCRLEAEMFTPQYFMAFIYRILTSCAYC